MLEKVFDNRSTRNAFLVLMSFVYLWAFSSLYVQIPGLYGDNGLLPIRSVLHCDSDDVLTCTFVGSKPTLLHLLTSSTFKLTPLQALEVTALLGILLSSLSIVFSRLRTFFVYVALWFCYFSCFQVGQTFLWFQWDTLLIETGFLTALVAPCLVFRSSKRASPLSWLPHDHVTMFLVKWLGFRYIFASGIVKLNAECPTWWNLTALHYHYESQCIPTPIAWYMHHQLDWIKRLSVVATFGLEIFVPILFFVPLKLVRLFAFLVQIFLMALIVLTGNYNFFNFLHVAICLSLLVTTSDDVLVEPALRGKKYRHITKTSRLKRNLQFVLNVLISAIIVLVLFVWPTIKLFALKFEGTTIESKIAFTKEEFFDAQPHIVHFSIVIGSLLFSIELVQSLRKLVHAVFTLSKLDKLKAIFSYVVICSISILMFSISLVPYAYLDNRSTVGHVWPVAKQLHDQLDKYQLVHAYGLFRSMTGVGGRPEVIVQGASKVDGPWKEYEFWYKAGNVSRAPPIVTPHQPRLDWQMWFAALGSYQHNPWFISLVWKLLNNEPQVVKLIESNPFPNKRPKFIKADLYLYHYTEADSKIKDWWTREKSSEYMPPISLQDANVKDFLIQHGLLIEAPKRPVLKLATNILRLIHKSTENFRHPQFIWSLTATVLMLWAVKYYFS